MDTDAKNADRLFEKFGRSYEGGDLIFAEGEPCNEIFMILEGRVRLIKKVRQVERDIAILRTDEIFGEHALTDTRLHPVSAVAFGKVCRLLALKTEDFRALLKQQSELALKLINQLIRRLEAAEDRIENMMLKDSQSKIVNALIRLAQQVSPDKTPVQLEVTPMELASKIGLDVDTTKQGIIYLRDNQYLSLSNEVLEIHDVEALQQYYQLIGMKEELKKE